MAIGKKFKLYTHNHFSLRLHSGIRPKKPGLGPLKRLPAAAYEICFLTGQALLAALSWFWKQVFGFGRFAALAWHCGYSLLKAALAREFDNTKQFWPKRSALLFKKEFIRSLSFFVFFALLVLSGLNSVKLIAFGTELKDKVADYASLGARNLTSAKQALENKDMAEAEKKLFLAAKAFENGKQQLRLANQIVNELSNVLPQKKDAEKLLETASLLSRTATRAIDLYSSVSRLKLTAEGLSGDAPNEELLPKIQDDLAAIAGDLKSAERKVASVNEKNVPENLRPQFQDLKSSVAVLEKTFQNLQELADLLIELGSGRKTVLVMFQNNNELRATGGFMGTFGELQIENGKIREFKISSIYELDGQLKEKILPPLPILNVTDRWSLRDSNWFADFPQTAKKMTSFYEKEGGETPDLIVAMTPNLVMDLLKLTGPVSMPDYGRAVDGENFVELVQVLSSVAAVNPINNPKQVLADFMPVLLQNLGGLEAAQWPEVMEILQNNLNSKHLAFYARDRMLQKRLEEYHWAGKILENDRDYLAVVSDNLGGTKTDLFIDQEVTLTTSIEADGSCINELSLTRTSRLPKLDDLRNLSFIRVLVPEGSQLISNSGFDHRNLDAVKQQLDESYRRDPQVYAWERTLSKDVISGTLTGVEAGKTFFGNWLSLEGGETKTVKLTYRLPFRLEKIDGYHLLVQKQMGSKEFKLNYNLVFPGRNIFWQNFASQRGDGQKAGAEAYINKDTLFGAVLVKNND